MFNERSSLTFMYLTLVGLWRPVFCESLPKKLAYRAYMILVIFLEVSVTLSQAIDTVFSTRDIDEILNGIYVFLVFPNGCARLFHTLFYREEIENSLKMLTEDPCKPSNEDENRIQSKYDGLIRKNLLIYTIWVESSVMVFVTSALIENARKKEQLLQGWYPFDCESTGKLWILNIYQTLAFVILSLILVSTDNLFSGLMLQICCQIEILQYRLRKIPFNDEQRDCVRECAHQHCVIYEFATMINKIMNLATSYQFFTSSLILCTTLLLLLKNDIFSTAFLAIFLYLCCMLVQLYIYCWFGTIVALKSSRVVDTIFHMDWVGLSKDVKLSLLMIMRRATLPIVLRVSYILNLNLDTFVQILKLSYSIFNVLNQTES